MPSGPITTERSRIQLCGRLSVEIDGAMLAAELRGRQVPLLLAYLVLNRGRAVGRDELAGALWPGQAPRSQDAALRTLLSRLRSALGTDALVGRDELALALPEPVWIDYEAATHELERAAAELESGEYRNAWALAQIPLNIAGRGLLPGASADWLELPRRELADVQLRALEVVGRAGLKLGGRQLAAVKRAARTLIDAEPYRESGHQLLMEALAADGNVAEALRAYDRFKRLLSAELGMTPSAEMIALHGRLVNPRETGSAAPAAAEDGPIPMPVELRAAAAGPFVGRSRELAELRAQWTLGDAGVLPARRLLLVRGDAGVGKTRLTAELAAGAHGAGAIVLAGRTPQEAVAPFQPFIEALRQYVLGAELETLRHQTREHGPELAPLAPELLRRLPEFARRANRDRAGERYRLFEAFVGVLTEISKAAPLLLVLDDLHWADRTTLLLLRHIARAQALGRVLLIGSYRASEAPSDAFTEALTELRRDPSVGEFALSGLQEADVAELVQVITGSRPSPALRQTLWHQTEGNPLFVEEIVRHLTESGIELATAGAAELQRAGLPPQVKDVIARRLAQLSPPALDLLRAAAAIGPDADAGLLEQVLGQGEDEFLGALEETLGAGLLIDRRGGDGVYGFAHGLIRETLYDGMSAPRRVRIHRRVATAIEARGEGPGRLSALALHHTRAADPENAEKAIAYAVAAAQEALVVSAHEEAAEHYAGALAVQGRLRADDSAARCRLLLARGDSLARAGDRSEAWLAFREAAEIAVEEGDTAAMVAAAIGASHQYLHQPAPVNDALVGLLDDAVAATAGDRTADRVTLLARLCGAIYFSPDRARMVPLSAEATEIARELDDPVALAHAGAAARRAHWRVGALAVRVEAATEMLRAARRAGALELELQAHGWLIVDLLEQGDHVGVGAQLEAFTISAERLRQPRYLWTASMWRGTLAHLAGDLAAAEVHAADALAIGGAAEPVLTQHYYVAQLLSIRIEQLRGEEIDADIARIRREIPGVQAWAAAHARLRVHHGDLTAARADLDALGTAGWETLPDDGQLLITLCLLSEVCWRTGASGHAAALYEMLAPYAERNSLVALAVTCWGSCERDLGLLAAAAGDPEAASRHLERAIERNRAQRLPVWTAHSRLDLAEIVGPGSRRAELVTAAARDVDGLELPLVARRLAALG